jgi:hypothetical protein
MTDCYQARFVDTLPYSTLVLQVKIVQAISILGIELLKCENTRLPNDSKAIDSHSTRLEIYQVSPILQNKVFRNVAGNFVKGVFRTLAASYGWPTLSKSSRWAFVEL